jgi:phage terminase large subunit-like protein
VFAAPDIGEALVLARREAPLMFSALWHSPRTSQSESIKAMLAPGLLFAFLLGGHRSGKTTGGFQMLVAYGLGREHPWVQAWCLLNGVDPMVIPSGPGTIWVVSGDSNDSRRIARPKTGQFLGTSARWRNKDGNGEAEAIIETELGIARWVFKSVDQGRDGFQGDSVRAVAFDEEPLDYEVVEESMFRVVDQAGRIFLFMTPIYGWTRLLAERVREVRSDTVVRRISGPDNPHVDQHALGMALSATSSHLKDARAHGHVTSAEGLVYPFDRALHVVPSFDPPRAWSRYLSIDFGVRNLAAWMYGALDPKDDVLHIFREHFQAGMTVGQHWEENKAWVKGDHLKRAIADPEDLNARMELEAFGLKTLEADKNIRGGIDAVSARLATNAVGRPSILVHDCCVNLIREFEAYRWPKQRPGALSDPKDAPVKKDDHALDAVRYLCKHLHRRVNPLEKLKRRSRMTAHIGA